ncbi:hypothetical protein [Neorhizobium sp. T7_12]|nr:hypothetical protein [Neorhizobium sp. T7_12]
MSLDRRSGPLLPDGIDSREQGSFSRRAKSARFSGQILLIA